MSDEFLSPTVNEKETVKRSQVVLTGIDYSGTVPIGILQWRNLETWKYFYLVIIIYV